MAILPLHSLAETLGDWDEIAEQLAEPSRKRLRYAFLKLTLIGQTPWSARDALVPQPEQRYRCAPKWDQLETHNAADHPLRRSLPLL